MTTLLVVPDFEQAEYVTLLTRQAKIKRVKLSEFEDVRPSGIIAMNLEPGDELGWARATAGDQEFIIVTAGGRALRFAETEVRAMGRYGRRGSGPSTSTRTTASPASTSSSRTATC